jgi:hypothetical protein
MSLTFLTLGWLICGLIMLTIFDCFDKPWRNATTIIMCLLGGPLWLVLLITIFVYFVLKGE